jgi:hypothetical protein
VNAQQLHSSLTRLCANYARRQREAAGRPKVPPLRFKIYGKRTPWGWTYDVERIKP